MESTVDNTGGSELASFMFLFLDVPFAFIMSRLTGANIANTCVTTMRDSSYGPKGELMFSASQQVVKQQLEDDP